MRRSTMVVGIGLAVPVALALAPVGLARGARAADFTVNTTADPFGPFAQNDGVVSLREALEAANGDGEPSTVTFDAALAGQVIRLGSELPSLFEDATTIDADVNADGRPDVELNGAYFVAAGIRVHSTGNRIRGLILQRFAVDAIAIEGPGATGNIVEACQLTANGGSGFPTSGGNGVAIRSGSGNVVRNCWLGTDAATATRFLGNAESGVRIDSGAHDNTVGPGNFIAFNAFQNGPHGGVAVLDGAIQAYPDFFDPSPAAPPMTPLVPDLIASFAAIDFPSTRGAFAPRGGAPLADGLGRPFVDTFGARFGGTIRIPAEGDYTLIFDVLDDNARVAIGGQVLLDTFIFGNLQTTVSLGAGDHAFRLDYFNGPGAAGLTFRIVEAAGGPAPTFPGGLTGELFQLRIPTERNRITRSSFFGNQRRPIELDALEDGAGVNINDPGDADVGPNTAINHPVLTAGTLGAPVQGGVEVTVTGTAPAGATVELFAVQHDPSAHGQGRVFLGDVQADGLGDFAATVVLPGGFAALTSTATDADGNTSEFGRNLVVGPAPPNDDPALAVVVPSGTPTPFVALLDVSAATTSPAIARATCAANPTSAFDVWYSYTPADDEILVVDTFRSSYDTFIAVFEAPLGGPAVACVEHGPGRPQALLRLPVTAGVTYLIAIGTAAPQAGSLRVQIQGRRPLDIDVLLYENGGGVSEQIALEALLARGAIRSYTVFDARTFESLSTRDIAAYDVLLVGWAGFLGSPTGRLDGNAPTDAGAGLLAAGGWQAAITGNVAITCMDPDLHFAFGSANPRDQTLDLLENLVVFAASGIGTGLVALSDPIGNFGFLPPEYGIQANGFGGEDVLVHEAATAHPINTTPNAITDYGLSRWIGSYHNRFLLGGTGSFQVVHRNEAGDAVTIAGRAPPAGFGRPAGFATGADVLVYGNGGGVSEAIALGALMERGAVRSYTVVNRFGFPRLTTAEIAAFDLLFVGWSGFFNQPPRGRDGNSAGDRYVGLLASGRRWQDAITGNAVITTQDPDFHFSFGGANPNAQLIELLENAVAFASAGVGTGLVATSDAMTSFGWCPFVPLASTEAGDDVLVAAPSHPVNSVPNVLQGAGLSNVGLSYHNTFRGALGLAVVQTNAGGDPLTLAGTAPFARRPDPDFRLPLGDGDHVVFLHPSPAEGNLVLDFRDGTWRNDRRQDGDLDDALIINATEAGQTALGNQVRFSANIFVGEQVDIARAGGLEPRRHAVPPPFDAAGAAPTGALQTNAAGTRRGLNAYATKYLLLDDRSRAIKLKLYGRDAFGRFVVRYAVHNVADPGAVDPSIPATLPRVPGPNAPPASGPPAGLPPAEILTTVSVNQGLFGPTDGVVGFIFEGALPADALVADLGLRRRPNSGGATAIFRGPARRTVVPSRNGRTYTIVDVALADVQAAVSVDETSRYLARLLGRADGFEYTPVGFNFDLTPPAVDRLIVASAGATEAVLDVRARDRSGQVLFAVESDRTGAFRPNVLGSLAFDGNVPLVGFDGATGANIFESPAVSLAARGAAPTFHAGPSYRIVLTDQLGNSVAGAPFTVPGGRALPPDARVRNERTGATFRFVQDAVDAAAGGDTIALAAGTYAELVVVGAARAGTAGAPTVLRAEPGAVVVLDGEGRLAAALEIVRASHVRVEGLRLTGTTQRALRAFLASDVAVVSCEVDGNQTNGLFFEESPRPAASFCSVHDNGRWGIFAFTSPEARYDHNLVVANGRGGFGLQARSTDASIVNNTLHGNGHWGGIVLFDGCGGADIRNNIITAHHGPSQGGADPRLIGGGIVDLFLGFGGAPSDGLLVAFNDVFDNDSDYLDTPDRTGQGGNISLDPAYADVAGRDFHLLPGSPAIDTGDPATPVGGEPMGGGGRVDMGRYGGTAEATAVVAAPPPAAPPGPAPTAPTTPPPPRRGSGSSGCALAEGAGGDGAGPAGLAPLGIALLVLLGARRRRRPGVATAAS